MTGSPQPTRDNDENMYKVDFDATRQEEQLSKELFESQMEVEMMEMIRCGDGGEGEEEDDDNLEEEEGPYVEPEDPFAGMSGKRRPRDQDEADSNYIPSEEVCDNCWM